MTTSSRYSAAQPDSRLVFWLGYAGLLPFCIPAGLIWLANPEWSPFLATVLAAYATAIASFLGGIHWGIAWLTDGAISRAGSNLHLGWGVTPSLLAWPALLLPPHAALLLLGAVLAACYAVDLKTYPAAGLSRWLPMRLKLTCVAVPSCLLGAAAAWVAKTLT
jgi:hypothetical protein